MVSSVYHHQFPAFMDNLLSDVTPPLQNQVVLLINDAHRELCCGLNIIINDQIMAQANPMGGRGGGGAHKTIHDGGIWMGAYIKLGTVPVSIRQYFPKIIQNLFKGSFVKLCLLLYMGEFFNMLKCVRYQIHRFRSISPKPFKITS